MINNPVVLSVNIAEHYNMFNNGLFQKIYEEFGEIAYLAGPVRKWSYHRPKTVLQQMSEEQEVMFQLINNEMCPHLLSYHCWINWSEVYHREMDKDGF